MSSNNQPKRNATAESVTDYSDCPQEQTPRPSNHARFEPLPGGQQPVATPPTFNQPVPPRFNSHHHHRPGSMRTQTDNETLLVDPRITAKGNPYAYISYTHASTPTYPRTSNEHIAMHRATIEAARTRSRPQSREGSRPGPRESPRPSLRQNQYAPGLDRYESVSPRPTVERRDSRSVRFDPVVVQYGGLADSVPGRLPSRPPSRPSSPPSSRPSSRASSRRGTGAPMEPILDRNGDLLERYH